MTRNHPTTELTITREQMIHLLNEDRAGEYQAIIAYLVFKHVLKGAAHTDIIRELEAHTGDELAQAIKIAKQIDCPGGIPAMPPKLVKPSKDLIGMLRGFGQRTGNSRALSRTHPPVFDDYEKSGEEAWRAEPLAFHQNELIRHATR